MTNYARVVGGVVIEIIPVLAVTTYPAGAA
jgi:hypothetical protein